MGPTWLIRVPFTSAPPASWRVKSPDPPRRPSGSIQGTIALLQQRLFLFLVAVLVWILDCSLRGGGCVSSGPVPVAGNRADRRKHDVLFSTSFIRLS